ncbi:MAG: glycosyltransferase family 4 protein [Bacteroidetes bacterium]|nr:MAG: glycosyltransferase family 4 protein [Bacteroidota bacterium]
MKIAQISPLYESVPPKYYGGTERVVHYLTEELVSRGHEVSLFASGDSITRGRLVAASPVALRLSKQYVDQFAPHYNLIELVEKEAHRFDIIHSHIDYMYYPLIRRSKTPVLTTLHGRLDLRELKPLYNEYRDIPLVSISDNQRKPVFYANWKKTVYHGLPQDLYHYKPGPGEYLVYLGRISSEKRVDRAVKIAVKSGIPLKIAAKVDKADQEYFETRIKHLFMHPLVEYIGEIGDHEKQELLGNAKALLYPVGWPEPFGLAMIEAMACGTPVIAFPCGSVPEVVDHGVTGFIVNSVNEAVEAVGRLSQLSRKMCREVFEDRFSVQRMVSDYLSVYNSLIQEWGNMYDTAIVGDTVRI